MVNRFRFCWLLFLLLASTYSKSGLQCATGVYSAHLQTVMISLKRSVEYFENNYKKLTFEGLFGLFVLNNSMGYLCTTAKLPLCFTNGLCHLHRMAEDVAIKAKQYLIVSKSVEYESLGFLSSVSWTPVASLQAVDYTNMTAFNDEVIENRSDACFSAIHDFQSGNCNISSDCHSLFLLGLRKGYGLTHQALYTWLLAQVGCSKPPELFGNLEYYRRIICSRVVIEFTQIKSLMSNSTGHRDLGLEQIFICGLSGYFQMVDLDLLDKIFTWQDASGCFKKVPNERLNELGSRTLLHEYLSEDQCLAHLSTVAVCALTVYVFRFVVDIQGLPSLRLSILKEMVNFKNRFLPALVVSSSPPRQETGEFATPYALVPDYMFQLSHANLPHHRVFTKSKLSSISILFLLIGLVYAFCRFLRMYLRRLRL